MTTNGATSAREDAYEKALIGGDLSELTAEERVAYYRRVCESLGLNYLTQPFAYIQLLTGAEGARVKRLVLYAKKDATDQLRRINRVSIDKPEIRFEDEWIIVTVVGHTPDGRSDADLGVVSRKDMRGDFGNAVMKAVTKAKRRVTLSICGLGWLDETEVETIPEATVYTDPAATIEAAPIPQLSDPVLGARKRFFAVAEERGLLDADTPAEKRAAVHGALGIPDQEGALRRWAERYGWDTARRLLEDGRTVQEYHAGGDAEDLDWESAFSGLDERQRPEDARGAH